MKKLIKKLIGSIFLFILVAAGVGYFGYQNRNEELPFAGFLEEKITKKYFPELYATADTVTSPEELLVNDLNQSRAQLDLEATKFAEERQKAVVVKDSLDMLKGQLDSQTAAKQGELDNKSQTLAKIYDTMKPAEVALIIEELDNRTAKMILEKMKPKNLAKVMGKLDRDKAVELSKAMMR